MATTLDKFLTKPASQTKAGSTKPQAGTVHWLNECIERGKAAVFSEQTMLTPGLAGELLRRNDCNRPVHPSKLAQYIGDIRAGRWEFNGEAIIISRDGLMNNGQHRSLSVIEANTPIRVLFTFGIERDTRMSLDQPASRTAGDYLQMEGVPNAKIVAAVARMIISYRRAEMLHLGRTNEVSNADIRALVHKDGDVGRAAHFAERHYRHARRFAPPAIIGFCRYFMSAIEAEDAEAYLTQVCVGENIKKSDPAFAVREGLLRERVTKSERVHLIFRGWNAFRQGRKLDLAKVSGNLPALI